RCAFGGNGARPFTRWSPGRPTHAGDQPVEPALERRAQLGARQRAPVVAVERREADRVDDQHPQRLAGRVAGDPGRREVLQRHRAEALRVLAARALAGEERGHQLRVAQQDVVGRGHQSAQRVARVARAGCGGLHLGEHAVEHAVDQRGPVRHVAVEGVGRDAEPLRDRAHRDRAALGEQLGGRVEHAVAAQPGALAGSSGGTHLVNCTASSYIGRRTVREADMIVDTAITGTAAGVPFVAVPPAGDRATAPVVAAWHLMDAPRTEAALAAALPLAGLDAWRIYLGLPRHGARSPEGGAEELMRLGHADAVQNLYGPITAEAAEEFGPAHAELRRRLGFRDGPIGLLGGSLGAAVAQLVIAGGGHDVAAAVLV